MNEFSPESPASPHRPLDSTGGRDSKLAERLINAIRVVAGEEPGGLVSRSEAFELMHEAARINGCLEGNHEENLARRRTRWKVLLRRALYAAAAGYASCEANTETIGAAPDPGDLKQTESSSQSGVSTPMCAAAGSSPCGDARSPDDEPGTKVNSEVPADPVSSVSIAEQIVSGEPAGLGLTLMLGGTRAVAVALAETSAHPVFWGVWSEDDKSSPAHPETSLDGVLTGVGEIDAGAGLPPWLLRRFDTVYVRPPTSGFTPQKAVSAAASALSAHPGRRLFLAAHPARDLQYFSLFSTLVRQGLYLDRLLPDFASVPLDPDFAHQLFSDLLDTPEAEHLLDPETLASLLSTKLEPEHLHLFRPGGEIRLSGNRLSLEPFRIQDLDLLDRWLTPEFCHELGFDGDRSRPTPIELHPENWYPGHEWLMARSNEGMPLGVVHLILPELWTKRTAMFDIGIAEAGSRGGGWMRDIMRLTYRRVFEHLGTESLCANVCVSNERARHGSRTNYFRPIRRFTDPDSNEELEEFRITRDDYRNLVSSGQLVYDGDHPT